MSIQIYNSETQKKEVFTPVHPGEVRMYVCGPTVYDYLHVGNFRGAIFFNMVRNWFEHREYQVTYVYNYTDVDDKIIKRAAEEGVDHQEVAEKYILEFQKDYESLKLRPHTHNPRVTTHMANIIRFVQDLVDKEKAYVVGGDVYFNVKSYSEYGKLSHKNIDDMEAGFRIEVDARKKHSADFALWKSAKPGEPSWPSPWGEGRPGWHIECSAMIKTLLGDTIDIHGGGMDLIFPHHENEIAQSEACTGKPFVKYWMHNNMLQFGNQKMSKSLGNVRTGRGFLEEYNGEILKYMMLSAHYRSTLDFSDAQVDLAIAGLARVYSSLALAEKIIGMTLELVPLPEKFAKAIQDASLGIEQVMDDDFNTPEVFARIFEVVRLFNSLCRVPGKVGPEKKAIAEVFFHWLKNQGSFLALFQESPKEYLTTLDDMLLGRKGLKREVIDALVIERTDARKSKDFKRSDEIRDQLLALGIAVQDSPEGSEWEVAK